MKISNRKTIFLGWTSWVAIILVLWLFKSAVYSQKSFEPIPVGETSKYRLNFERNFFASLEAERFERSKYYKKLTLLENMKGKIANSPNNLLMACSLYDEVLVEYMRHSTYLYLRTAINTRDLSSKSDLSTLDSEFYSRTSFVQQELMRINADTYERYTKRVPGLAKYRFKIESAQRYRSHTLTLSNEKLLAATSALATEWQNELYGDLLRRTVFGKIDTAEGTLDVFTDRRSLRYSPNRKVREDSFKRLYQGYNSNRDLYAFALINLANARNILARQRGFEDAPSEVFFDSYWTKREVENKLKEIQNVSEVYRRYQQMRRDLASKRIGDPKINIWDLSGGSYDSNPPRFTIDQASNLILEALSPLGSEYSNELNSLLDPANGRMDIVPGPDRKLGGFSKGFPGVTTVFFSGGFSGFYSDMRVLAHESTHAVHRQLMKNGNILPDYASGPSFLFESFAIFNELLLADYLYRHEPDPGKKRFYLEQFFEGKGLEMITVGMEEELELAISDGVDKGEIESADDLDELTKSIGGRYSIWFEKHDELKMLWITSSLFYEDPFYDVNYVYGSLLALKYLDLYSADPKRFMPQYIALLKNGFNSKPDVLLRRFLSIDMNDHGLVNSAVQLLKKRLSLLQVEYSKDALLYSKK